MEIMTVQLQYPGHVCVLPLRLELALERVHTDMKNSYEKFAEHITELKMDHDGGKLASDRLTESLACIMVLFRHNSSDPLGYSCKPSNIS